MTIDHVALSSRPSGRRTGTFLLFMGVLIAAGLFIPAWAGGWTIVWTLPFAIVLAAYVRLRLQIVYAGAARCRHADAAMNYIRGKPSMILAEVMILTTVPQSLALLLMSDVNTSHGGTLDAVLYQAIFTGQVAYQYLSPASRYAIAAIGAALFFFAVLSLAAVRPLWRVTAAYLHRSVTFPRNPEEARQWARLDGIANFSAILATVIPCLYFLSVPRLVADTVPTLAAWQIGLLAPTLATAELIFIISLLVGLIRLGTHDQ